MSDEFKLQWSVSLPPVAQYAKGHMFNFRSDTVEGLTALFDEVLASETVQKALDVAALLTGAQTVTTATAPAAVPTDGGATVTQLPTGDLKTCNHGVREYKEGTNRSGKRYAGWFCPSKNKNDECKPVWKD